MAPPQMEQQRHRQYPGINDINLELNVDASEIKTMREETKEEKDEIGNPVGPISDAIKRVKDFDCSASRWNDEHLKRFQVVVLKELDARYLFPEEYIPFDSDSTMKALKNDGFFSPTVKTIVYGEWKQDKLYHFVFLSIMQILRGGDRTPTPYTSPKTRIVLPRDSKLSAIEAMNDMYTATRNALLPELSRISSGSTMSTDQGSVYAPSSSTHQSKTIIDRGPRETLTFNVVHNFLCYLGTIEQQKRQKDKPTWIPRYQSIFFVSNCVARMQLCSRS
jgi:hypothetical protein